MVSESSGRRLERVIKVILLVVLLASLTGVGYVALNPPSATDPYTEFYILGPNGNASNYPTNLTAGETGSVIVGISNHEGEDLTYSVVFRLNGTVVTTDAITVGAGETREQLMSFTVDEPGRYRLQINLYRTLTPDEAGEPYRTLRLWIDVSEAET